MNDLLYRGIPIYTDPHIPTTEKQQVRHPRSKKRRIQKKWTKNPSNWATVPCERIYLVPGSALSKPHVIMHPVTAEKFRRQIGRINL